MECFVYGASLFEETTALLQGKFPCSAAWPSFSYLVVALITPTPQSISGQNKLLYCNIPDPLPKERVWLARLVRIGKQARSGHKACILHVPAGLTPMFMAPVYSATKHGVVGFSRSMIKVADRDSVRVNCVCPTFVDTKMMTAADDEIRTLVRETGMLE
jgi:NAD(P)-dependent dehydrogenase (short-subunit alcohol dehydrogenase family)